MATRSGLSEQQEREDKFHVDLGFVVPDFFDLVPDGGRTETATYRLKNTYYDTADADLRRMRLTLRRRVGGPDAGWHLKLPAGAARTEIHSRSRGVRVPKALADPLLGVRRGQDLVPVATLSTTRYLLRLLDADGALMAEVADDQVESATLGNETTIRNWRELEVELGSSGDEKLLAQMGERLVEWGASPSPFASKLSQALGLDADSEPAEEPKTLGELLTTYLAAQVDAITAGDLGLRLGRPVVHPTRVAVRRLRSTMRVFAPVFDEGESAHLEAELVWYAGLLGEVRDREVLRARLLEQVAALPPEFVLGPVAAQIKAVLTGEEQRHLKRVATAMRGERYLSLVDNLHRWRSDPPVTDRAGEPATRVRKFVDKAERKLYRRLGTAGGDHEALHRARKAGKRFRYAAELSEPVLGKHASKAVEHGKHLQQLLGEHQDSVVSAEFLRRQGAAAGVNPDQNGFTYGILLAGEWQRAEDVRRQLTERFG
ncbi:MAG TPA: CYTH and CHAD domain-containing protein [Propionibacteriaceae bacterium]|nr:CYTH and CHAD domain-containing protein [Propionibacteriaceae bacterium]